MGWEITKVDKEPGSDRRKDPHIEYARNKYHKPRKNAKSPRVSLLKKLR